MRRDFFIERVFLFRVFIIGGSTVKLFPVRIEF